MANFLALDWDSREFHLVAANVHRGKVHIQRAVSWLAEEPFVSTKAEQFGERLREEMKKAGIAPAPLIVGLGRDRVVVKEVRFPQVSAEVEAPLVRNQIIKDLTEAADDVFLDYSPLAEPSRTGERRALSVVVRKDMITALQTVSRVAGVKLVAVTARPFGVAACLHTLAGTTPQVPAPPTPEAVTAVLTVTGSWAEFCAVRGQQLLFARSMAGGDGLLGEVRRNLAAYAGQPQLTFPRDAIQALYVCGNGENAVLREKLQETLGIPVYGLDPFAKEERIDVEAASRAGFTGAFGLLQLWAVDQTTPVNFVKPRESKQTASPTKKRVYTYSGVGVLAAVFLAVLAFWVVNVNYGEAARLKNITDSQDRQLKELAPELKFWEALGPGGWSDAAIPWVDELYDLAARAPFEKDFRITRIDLQSFVPTPAKSGGGAPAPAKEKDKNKERYTGRIKITGIVANGKVALVQKFVNVINNDKHCRCTNDSLKKSGVNDMEFTLKVELMHQLPSQYTARLVLPPPPPAKKAPVLKIIDDDE